MINYLVRSSQYKDLDIAVSRKREREEKKNKFRAHQIRLILHPPFSVFRVAALVTALAYQNEYTERREKQRGKT